MRFLIDECLHESLIGVAHAAGLAARIVKDEFTFVTNNRVDFVRLFGMMELHAGLIVLVPNLAPALAAGPVSGGHSILAGKSLINAVIEVTSDGKTATCVEYQLPAD